MDINELAKKIADTKAKHHEASIGERVKNARDLAAQIKAMQTEMSDLITKGANMCPKCLQAPIGIRQPKASGGAAAASRNVATVPAKNEPIAAIASAGPARPLRAIW